MVVWACVYVCVYTCTHTCMYICTCMCMCVCEANAQCLPLSPPSLFSGSGSLDEPGLHHFSKNDLASEPQGSSCLNLPSARLKGTHHHSQFSNVFIYSFVYVSTWYVHHMCSGVYGGQKSVTSPGTGDPDNYEPPCGFWGLMWSPL